MDNKILLKHIGVTFEPHKMNQNLPFIFHEDAPQMRATCNVHENPEFLCITCGSGTVRCGEKNIQVAAGDVVAIDSFCVHEIISHEQLKYYCLIIDHTFCEKNGVNVGELCFVSPIRSQELVRQFERLADEFYRNAPFRDTAIRSSVLSILLLLCRNYSMSRQTEPAAMGALGQSIYRAMEYVRKNAHKKLSLDEIAGQVGFSKYYFAREFKRVTGFTLIQYINSVRCEQAAILLAEGHHTVKEVAVMTGFDNFSYFSSVFKKHTSVLPSEYVKSGK